MRVTVTYYLDVISSWCFWSEPTWAALKERYEGRVEFQWKIALMDESGFPTSHAQMDWFYRRSGMLMRSPFMLSSAWHEPGLVEYLAPNLLAEAARDFGVRDDRVRLALASAGLREGMKTGDWDVASAIAAASANLDKAKLLERARAPEVEARVRESTAAFHALQVTQRPTFVFGTEIGDRAVFSGFVKLQPFVETLEAMLDDVTAYAAHAAHFGLPPE